MLLAVGPFASTMFTTMESSNMMHSPNARDIRSRRLLLRALPSLLVYIFLTHAWACGGESEAGGKGFGECCQSDADCESNVCHPKHLACTVLCQKDDQCPPEPKTGNPSCAVKSGDTRRLCQAERDGDVCANK